MSIVRRTLVLTGGRAGCTCVLAKYPFVNGRLTLEGSPTTVDNLTRYLGRTYAAYPEDSVELEEANKNGTRGEVRPVAGGARAVPVPSGGGPRKRGVAAVPAPDGSPGDDAPPGGAAELPPRDRHPHPGLHWGAERVERVRAALAQLDAGNNEHWSVDGKPALAAVAALAGLNDLTRAELDAEGVARPAAEEAKRVG